MAIESASAAVRYISVLIGAVTGLIALMVGIFSLVGLKQISRVEFTCRELVNGIESKYKELEVNLSELQARTVQGRKSLEYIERLESYAKTSMQLHQLNLLYPMYPEISAAETTADGNS